MIGGLDRCASKRGFYTLRDCEKAATTTCSVCSRRVCDEHLAPRVDVKVCAECAARQDEEGTAGAGGATGPGMPFGAAAGAGAAGLGLGATFAAMRYRNRFYRRRSYRPMYWATPDPYWNDYGYGYRYYDSDLDDEDDGGFGDS